MLSDQAVVMRLLLSASDTAMECLNVEKTM